MTTVGLPVPISPPIPTSYKPKTAMTNVVVNGDTYILPEKSIELPQVNGSSMTLAPSLVVHDGKSYTVPHISEPTSLSSPDAASPIRAFPAPNKKPPTDGLTGLPGLTRSLENIASEALKASSALNETMDKGTQWATKSRETNTSETLSDVERSLNEGFSRLRSVVLPMAGVVSDTEFPFDDLPPTGKRIFEALEQTSSSMLDLFQYIRKLISSVPNVEGHTRKHVEDVLRDFFSVASERRAIIEAGLFPLGLFGTYDWSQMQPSFKFPAIANTTSTLSNETAHIVGRSENASFGTTGPTTNTSTHTSGALNSSTALKPYLIVDKDESFRNEFTSWLKTANLPDRGNDPKDLGNASFPDLYMTYLTDDDAAKIRNLSFIGYAIPVSSKRRGRRTGVASAPLKTPNWKKEKRDVRTQNAHIWRRPDSPYQLDLMANFPGPPMKRLEYHFEISLGLGSTIYIVDSGCDINHPELSPNGRQARMRGWPEDPRYFANDEEGHGTKTASVAAGKNIGVASNANIVCVNTASSNGMRGREDDILEMAFEWIKDDIRTHHLQKRAVILFTESKPSILMVFRQIPHFDAAFDLLWGDPAREPTVPVFQRWIPRFKALYVPFVVSAGNDGQKWFVLGEGGVENPEPNRRLVPMSLDYSIPQRLGPLPGMITVGGVNRYGQLWTDTTPKVVNGRGYIDVYAMADDTEVAEAGTHDTDEDFGTSYAAAATSACPAPPASSTSSSPSTPPSSTTSTSPTPSEDCKTKYKVVEDDVTISGTAWDANKLRSDGSGLKKAVKKCGDVTKWKWQSPVDGWDFTATFHIGVFMKNCISSKMEEAGSPSNVCHGSS
ncbi:MAG: hypothetical protein Q9165_004067 [Trypethelium subeluteriae]